MATPTRRERPVRALLTLAVIAVAMFGGLLAGMRWSDASLTPSLALDLEGGTQLILEPVAADDSEVTPEILDQAIEIIRQRVDASGVAEAEITRQGERNIVVGLPGRPSEETLDLVRESAQMLFRPVLYVGAPVPVEPVEPDGEGPLPAPDATSEPAPDATAEPAPDATPEPAPTEEATGDAAGEAGEATAAGAADVTQVSNPVTQVSAEATEEPADAAEEPATEEPAAEEPAEAPEPTDASDLAWLTEDLFAEFQEYDCTAQENLTGGSDLIGDPDAPVVACADDGTAKYILGPVELSGIHVESASSGLRVGPTGAVTNEWVANIDFGPEGTDIFRDVTSRLLTLEPPRNQFAMVLDGLVISAPSVNTVIPDGNAEISGDFDRESAGTLARQLNFGALPLTFEVQTELQISATLGSEQLQRGLLAGVIGLVLVGVYSIVQYRALGLVTVASLIVAGVLTYGAIALLSWTQGYRLSLPGVAGLIVAIGITADSFIVYFERIRDELRDGRSLVSAVEVGWRRARRTILASDAVSFLAAVVLYLLAVGGVRGFAFTLGLTTLVDLLVVFLFTHPVMALLARTKFFGQGHRLSGLDPRLLSGKPSRYVGRGRVVPAGERAGRAPAGATPLGAPDAAKEQQLEPVGPGGRRMTIAERRAAERRAAVQGGDPSTEGKDA